MFQLSRLASRAAFGQSQNLARGLSTTPARLDQNHPIFANEDPAKNPERDLVNFPRRKRALYESPTRHFIFPEEWFTFFHEKTGVTGPYIFAASVGTFLFSKEIWVMEHEFYCGVALAIVLNGIRLKAGDGLYDWLKESVEEKENAVKKVRQDEIDRCKAAIAEEENSQWMATSYKELIEAKKENVGLQLEIEYRSRLNEAYKQVKKRLDYQLATANVLRAAEQKHMVQWIIDNVRKSITAKQEADALKACVADLKALAK